MKLLFSVEVAKDPSTDDYSYTQHVIVLANTFVLRAIHFFLEN